MSLVALRRPQEQQATSGIDNFDRIFDNFFRNAMTNIAAPASSVGSVALRMNVSETDKAYHIDAELPGIDEKDIELTVKDGVLTLSGEKQTDAEEDGKTYHRIERSYGCFQRSLQLPQDADEGHIEAHVKNGILFVEIGKMKEAQKMAKRISIKRK